MANENQASKFGKSGNSNKSNEFISYVVYQGADEKDADGNSTWMFNASVSESTQEATVGMLDFLVSKNIINYRLQSDKQAPKKLATMDMATLLKGI